MILRFEKRLGSPIAAGVHPEMVYTIASSLLLAELDLFLAYLLLSAFLEILKSDSFAILSLSMREYRVGWDADIFIFHQTQVPMPIIWEKTHLDTFS
jgi:hypothetical protein